MEALLSLIRCDAEDDRPDMWTLDRIELGLKSAERSISVGNQTEALSQIDTVVKLLEDAMKITDEILLPTSCRFLDGMEWRAFFLGETGLAGDRCLSGLLSHACRRTYAAFNFLLTLLP